MNLMLPTIPNGLVLLEHICQHLETGIGLRQIIDWMMYVNAKLHDEIWYDQFEAACENIGLRKLAMTVTKMCQLYLGLDPDITWCDEIDEGLCESLMGLIIESGNFGRKQGPDTRKSVNTLLAARNFSALFHRLQYRGTNNWTLLKKYPYLKPFAWLYQLIRYIRKGLLQEQPFRSLVQDMKASRNKDDVLSRLEVSRQTRGCKTPNGIRF